MRTLLLALMLASPACADTIGPITGEKQWPAGPMRDYLERLQRPDNHARPNTDGPSRSCCGAGDVVDTRFKVEASDQTMYPDDVWYAWLQNEWVRIPAAIIVPDFAPDGRAYLFMLVIDGLGQAASEANYMVCFVRPKGGI
jgi:hypothetical protein